MKIDKQTRRVIYVDSEDIYRVTFDPVGSENRKPRDSKKHIVGIAAAVSFWDNVDKRNHCLGCARTVKEAWDAGDRYLIDSDKARKAAELVADLSCTRPDDIDICSAITDLMNAIAEVRLNNTPIEDFDVLPACEEAFRKCFAIPEFSSWSDHSRMRKFLYSVDRKMRNPVVYTLICLYFKRGIHPIITNRQYQELQSIPRGEGLPGAIEYMDDCLRKITGYRFS